MSDRVEGLEGVGELDRVGGELGTYASINKSIGIYGNVLHFIIIYLKSFEIIKT